MGFARNKVPAEQNAEVLDIEEGLVYSSTTGKKIYGLYTSIKKVKIKSRMIIGKLS